MCRQEQTDQNGITSYLLIIKVKHCRWQLVICCGTTFQYWVLFCLFSGVIFVAQTLQGKHHRECQYNGKLTNAPLMFVVQGLLLTINFDIRGKGGRRDHIYIHFLGFLFLRYKTGSDWWIFLIIALGIVLLMQLVMRKMTIKTALSD